MDENTQEVVEETTDPTPEPTPEPTPSYPEGSILGEIATMILGSFEPSGSSGINPFQTDLIIHINSALSTLTQLGVGSIEGFAITGTDETWSDFLLGNRKDVEMIKSYVYMKVRLMFDPPQNSFLVDSLEKQCKEFEWRANVAVDTKKIY